MGTIKGIKKSTPSTKPKKSIADKGKLKKRKQIVERTKRSNIENGTVDSQEKIASKLKSQNKNKKKMDHGTNKNLKLAGKIESFVTTKTSNGVVDVAIKKRKKSDLTLPNKNNSLKQLNKNGDSIINRNEIKTVKTNLRKKAKKVGVQNGNITFEDNANIADLDFTEFEKKFNVKVADVENGIKGVLKVVSNNPKSKNELFDEERPIFLQINATKIPHIKGKVKTVFRIPLINSILPTNADICLIVPDVKGIKNNEHEQHIEHYETLLKNKGVTGIKKIMTFHEFRTEYDTFELKNRLVDLYDFFLVDGRIGGKVVRKGGNIFYQKRKLPISIKLQATQLNSQIDSALKKVFFQLSFKGDSHMVQFGHTKMPLKALMQNVYNVIEYLSKNFPGKMENINSLHVNVYREASIPIYLSMKNPNEINVPTLKSKINKNITSVTDELTTQYNAHVTVKLNGVVVVKRTSKKIEDEENKVEDSTGDPELTLAPQDNDAKSGKSKRKCAEEQISIPSKKKKKIAVKKVEEKQMEQLEEVKNVNTIKTGVKKRTIN